MNNNLSTGSFWPYHYRGSKYHMNQSGEVYWLAPLKMTKVPCIKGHENIVDALFKLKPTGGSFRITEDRDVITRKIEGDNNKSSEKDILYVGKLRDQMEFEDVDISPDSIESGNLWTAFYEGAEYHFNSEGKIWWSDSLGRRCFATSKHPELIEYLLKFKRQGGSFKITENRHVLTLINRFPNSINIQEQVDKMSDLQKSIIEYREQNIKMVPVFLCMFSGKVELADPLDMRREWSEEETEGFIERLKNLGKNSRR